jgi:hypothetical protein
MSNFQQRDRKDFKPSGDSVDNEVQRLLKEHRGKLPYSEVQKLKAKYNNDKLVDAIQEAFATKLKHVQKTAEAFANRVHEKYGSDYPMHKLLEKARKYKVKKDLSDGEFEEFRRAYERILSSSPAYQKSEYSRPSTNLGRTLGTINVDPVEGLKVSDEEYSVLQEILKMYSMNKMTHNQVVIQALTHDETNYLSTLCQASNNLSGVKTDLYDPSKHNYLNAIHPVVFAMFAVKVHLFEHRMLLANLPNIVRARYNKESVQTKPDYELLYDLITDPNDVVCDRTSPVKDLRNRCLLQDALHRCVLNMRMKRFFEPCSAELAVAIESCRLMNVENPELLYSGDESVYLRRIVNTFSLRPTIVRTDDSTLLSGGPFQQVSNVPMVSSLNILTLRLPPQQGSMNKAVRLDQAMQQAQFFIENGRFVTKNQKIIYSRNVLLFNVLRKYNRIFMNKLFAPFNFQNLPISVSSLEKINNTNVEADWTMSIGNDMFHLRAVVGSVMTELQPGEPKSKVVTGCATHVFNYGAGPMAPQVAPLNKYKYNPYIITQDPTKLVTETFDQHEVETQSTVYIYATMADNVGTNVLNIDY